MEWVLATLEALLCTEATTWGDFTDNNIGRDGPQHLAAALKENATLQKISLDRNNIGDQGAQHLAAALRQNSTLCELSLYGNNIGVPGAASLAAALKRNR
eukprot:EG_transcript_63133